MAKDERARQPKQKRSIQLKERILDTALELFCEKGFYKTTTNEIADAADVNIASLYSYFKNKEDIFYEILSRYHSRFISFHENAVGKIEASGLDKKKWLYNLITGLIAIHESTKEFNRELKGLYYADPQVAKIIDQQNDESQKAIFEYLLHWKDEITVDDLQIAAIITFDIITAIVDRIVFDEVADNKDKILEAGVEAIYKYLIR